MRISALIFLSIVAIGCANSTAPNAPSVNSSSVKASLRAYDQAANSGDVARAKSLAVYDDVWEKYIEADVAGAQALKAMDAAALKRWGESSKRSFEGINLEDLPGATFQVSGDYAVLLVQSQPVRRFKRVDGQWKLDVRDDPAKCEHMTRFARTTARAAEQTTQRINAGEFKDPEQAYLSFQNQQFVMLKDGQNP